MIAVASSPVLAYAMFFRYHKTKLSVKRQRKREGQSFSRMNEVLSAMPLVQAFGRERYEEEKFDDITSQTLEESIRLSRLQAAANRSSASLSELDPFHVDRSGRNVKRRLSCSDLRGFSENAD